jgi:hypothetical protein
MYSITLTTGPQKFRLRHFSQRFRSLQEAETAAMEALHAQVTLNGKSGVGYEWHVLTRLEPQALPKLVAYGTVDGPVWTQRNVGWLG